MVLKNVRGRFEGALKNIKYEKLAKIRALVNDGWVKNTILRLQTPGFSLLHVYKGI